MSLICLSIFSVGGCIDVNLTPLRMANELHSSKYEVNIDSVHHQITYSFIIEDAQIQISAWSRILCKKKPYITHLLDIEYEITPKSAMLLKSNFEIFDAQNRAVYPTYLFDDIVEQNVLVFSKDSTIMIPGHKNQRIWAHYLIHNTGVELPITIKGCTLSGNEGCYILEDIIFDSIEPPNTLPDYMCN
jgi:hypothetical protein